MRSFKELYRTALSPTIGFEALAQRPPGMGRAVLGLLQWRSPLALAEALLAYEGFRSLYAGFLHVDGPVWRSVFAQIPTDADSHEIQSMLDRLPPLPTVISALPWFLAAAPILVLSLWIHDAAWDHGCLWLLRGSQKTQGFRTTLLAEADALQVGTIGALIGLLIYLPSNGPLLSFPIAVIGIYFWVMRGFALAAFHGCPLWKGVTATILHGFLMGCCALGFVGLLVIVLAQGLT